MGGAVSAGVDNDDLVDNLKVADYIKTPLVERIFRAVDRGAYFTSEHREQAYRDNAWKKGNLHLSAPCIYAQVMESLQLAPGHSFLNLGSGTGYLSTMAGLIIGPYGINHGVELHADVLSYAHDRLEDFKKTPALDAFSFCNPQFVQGNCLCLPLDIRMYDRVYCGASCPETHENYMKGLIKEGGMLVMPLNDQLVKITRIGPSTWETSSLLPVSFSSLVMPDTSHPPASVPLPEVELLDLQDMCRQEVRSILRANIDVEHPDLATAANAPVQKQRTRCNGQQFPGVFVPYMSLPFYGSDEEPGGMSDDIMDDGDDSYFYNPHNPQPRRNRLTTVIEFARSVAEHRMMARELQNRRRDNPQEEDENGDDKDTDEVENEEENDDSSLNSSSDEEKHDSEAESDSKQDKVSAPNVAYTRISFLKKGKVRKGTPEEKVEESKPGNGEAATSSVSTMPQSDPIPMASTPVMPLKINKKREKFDSGVGDEIENGKGPSSEESDQCEEADIEMDIDSVVDSDFSDGSPDGPRLRSRTRSKVIRPYDPNDDVDCPCGGDCIDILKDKKYKESKEDVESQSSASPPAPPAESYCTYMKEKLGLLPLPQALKLYLNYYREL